MKKTSFESLKNSVFQLQRFIGPITQFSAEILSIFFKKKNSSQENANVLPGAYCGNYYLNWSSRKSEAVE